MKSFDVIRNDKHLDGLRLCENDRGVRVTISMNRNEVNWLIDSVIFTGSSGGHLGEEAYGSYLYSISDTLLILEWKIFGAVGAKRKSFQMPVHPSRLSGRRLVETYESSV